jgi:ATP-dependent helicase/nuclease subunit B
MRIFLPWTDPFLPAVAAKVIRDCAEASPGSHDADFSKWLFVARGRSAARRLLALLATEAQRAGRALIPPRIVTPGSLDSAIFGNDPTVAENLTQRLAWTVAVQRMPAGSMERIWTMPRGRSAAKNLAGVLDRTWTELGTSGVDFSGAFAELSKIAPDSADMEQERWDALQELLDAYRAILQKWEFTDPAARRARLAATGRPPAELRVALIGIIELSPALIALLRTLPVQPSVFIHAPESDAAGFDEWGRLIPSFWSKRPCRFANGEIHVVRGVKEQAERCAELIHHWRKAGLAASGVTVAVPEPAVLPALLHGLADASIEARAAEGRPATRTGVLLLLSQLADFLDRRRDEPPSYESVAALVRHPDLAGIVRSAAKSLDDFFEDHLPLRVHARYDGSESTDDRIAGVLDALENLAAIRSSRFSEDIGRLLLRVYGHHKVTSHSDEGRALLVALEAVRSALDEIERLPRKAVTEISVAELLEMLVEVAGKNEVPEPERADAVELAGWLEAAADDAPALIVTSVIEGSLPEGAPVEPLLLDSLRERLGLPCRASRFARDQYTLHTVWMSRRAHGRFALLAPRRTGEGLPARPSRLLLGAHTGAELAKRLLCLASEPRAATPSLTAAAGLLPPEPDPEKMRAFRIFPVTSFRNYLQSPRLFYFKNVLRLQTQDDSADELDPGTFGTVIHAVLQTFGERHAGTAVRASAADIERETTALLNAHMKWQFGDHALPPVRAQQRALETRLGAFAEHQAALFAEGWQIAYVEKNRSLTVPFAVPGGPPDVMLKGRIDRIDRHPDGRWRIIDYKTSSTAVTPDAAHFAPRSGAWKDLQLPLYVKLLPALGDLDDGPVSAADAELVYFNLPPKADEAGITDPFDSEKIPGAWERAAEIIAEVCSGYGCREIGDVHDNEDPAFLALCGLNGLPTTTVEE